MEHVATEAQVEEEVCTHVQAYASSINLTYETHFRGYKRMYNTHKGLCNTFTCSLKTLCAGMESNEKNSQVNKTWEPRCTMNCKICTLVVVDTSAVDGSQAHRHIMSH
jgi:hypothetical protein